MVVADSTFDVLVIGSGASGLAAAVSAERAGAKANPRPATAAQVEELLRSIY